MTAPALCLCSDPSGLRAGNCLICRCRELYLSSPSHSHYLYLYTHLHSPFPFLSVCILHLYLLPSLLTEVGKLPSAGASSRCSLFLSSLPPSLLPSSLPPSHSLSLCFLALPLCTLRSVSACVFFSPPFSFVLSLSGGSSGRQLYVRLHYNCHR